MKWWASWRPKGGRLAGGGGGGGGGFGGAIEMSLKVPRANQNSQVPSLPAVALGFR